MYNPCPIFIIDNIVLILKKKKKKIPKQTKKILGSQGEREGEGWGKGE